MAQFAAFAQDTHPHRVLKIIQGAEVAPSGVLLSRAGAAPSTSESQVLGSTVGGKGWGESHLQPARREEMSAGSRSSALAMLPKQLPPGLELPPLCKHHHQLPALMEQIGLKGKQNSQRKQHMVIGVDLLGETCS